MIGLIRRLQYQKAIERHPNYRYEVKPSIYNSGARVAIISSTEYASAVSAFASALKKDSPQVTSLFFSQGKLLEETENTYSAKEVNWVGVPQGEVIEDFLSKEYDRMFYLDFQVSKSQEYLIRLCKTALTIGPTLPGHDVAFDLGVETSGKDINVLIRDIKRGLDSVSFL